MTETEWLTAREAIPMLDFLHTGIIALVDELPTKRERDEMRAFLQGNARRRKFGLLGCACCRHLWGILLDHRSRSAVEVFEQSLDGHASDGELQIANSEAIAARNAIRSSRGVAANTIHTRRRAAHVVYAAIEYECYEVMDESGRAATWAGISATLTEARSFQADTIRDIFGNPFRPVAVEPAWLTSTVVAIANQMYESRDFSAMPILADALQDAGCDNDDIMNHCRDEKQTHVRGCWVIDLILGKE